MRKNRNTCRFARKILPAQLKSKSLGAFFGIGISGFCKLLHQIAVPIAMWHFMLAHRPRDLSLIETEEQKIQRDGIKLHCNCSYAEPSEKLYMKRSAHDYFKTPSSFPTFVNAAIARSKCSRSCAAEICTRMRA